MKIAIIVIVCVLITGFIAMPLGIKMGRLSPTPPDVTAVRIEAITRGDLSEIVSAPGQVEPLTRVQISAKVVARINRLPFAEGDLVKVGDSLVELDSTELEAQLKAVKARYEAQSAQLLSTGSHIAAQDAQISAARVTLANAERDLKRQKELLISKDVSQSTVDDAQSKVDEQKSQLQATVKELDAAKSGLVAMQHELVAAEAEIARATDNLSYTKITSPINGVVTRVNGKAGELVVTGTMNNQGTVIMEVADLSQMLVVARIDESTRSLVKKGQKAQVRLGAYIDDVFEGTVRSVALDTILGSSAGVMASMSQNNSGPSTLFKTEILLDNKDRRIFSGLSADVDIETETHKNVLKVPSQAVLGRPTDNLPAGIRDQKEVDKNKTLATVVYRFIDGKAVITPVIIGASDISRTAIKSGLKDGESVIVGPFKALESIQHDQKVKDERATTQPAAKSS